MITTLTSHYMELLRHQGRVETLEQVETGQQWRSHVHHIRTGIRVYGVYPKRKCSLSLGCFSSHCPVDLEYSLTLSSPDYQTSLSNFHGVKLSLYYSWMGHGSEHDPYIFTFFSEYTRVEIPLNIKPSVPFCLCNLMSLGLGHDFTHCVR